LGKLPWVRFGIFVLRGCNIDRLMSGQGKMHIIPRGALIIEKKQTGRETVTHVYRRDIAAGTQKE